MIGKKNADSQQSNEDQPYEDLMMNPSNRFEKVVYQDLEKNISQYETFGDQGIEDNHACAALGGKESD